MSLENSDFVLCLLNVPFPVQICGHLPEGPMNFTYGFVHGQAPTQSKVLKWAMKTLRKAFRHYTMCPEPQTCTGVHAVFSSFLFNALHYSNGRLVSFLCDPDLILESHIYLLSNRRQNKFGPWIYSLEKKPECLKHQKNASSVKQTWQQKPIPRDNK